MASESNSLWYLNSDSEATIQAVNRNKYYLAEILGVIQTADHAGLFCYPNSLLKDRAFFERVSKGDSASFDLNIRVLASYEEVSKDMDNVMDAYTKTRVVVEKRLRPGKEPDWWRSRLKEMELEIGILCYDPVRKCENIVDILGYSWELNPVIPMIYLEYAPYGSLETFLQYRGNDLSWDQKRKACFEIANALQVLHQTQIVHCVRYTVVAFFLVRDFECELTATLTDHRTLNLPTLWCFLPTARVLSKRPAFSLN